MEWDDDMIARLRTLWAEGLSTAEIGRRIAVTKNAVVGKAHRIGLEPRPSPIRRDGPAAPPVRAAAARRVMGPTLPPLAASRVAATPAPPPPATPPSLPTASATPPPQRPPAAAAPAPPPAAAGKPAVRPVPAAGGRRCGVCCWPIGEPGTRSFRFCDLEAISGKPYCYEHAQLAYVKVRDRREEAA
jgi:GcrA cell cycle regulator